MNRLALSLAALPLLVAGCGGDTTADDASSADTGADLVDAPAADAPGLDTTALDASTEPDAPASSGVLVRAAEGGLVESADGLFEIHVFPGALAADTTITITRVADADVPADIAATDPISAVYSVEPDGLTFGGDGAYEHFAFPVPPAALRPTGAPTSYVSAGTFARPAAGGPITAAPEPLTSFRADGSAHALARLDHLSFHWASSPGDALPCVVDADLRGGTHPVGRPWSGTGFVQCDAELRANIATLAPPAGPVTAIAAPGAVPATGVEEADSLARFFFPDSLMRVGFYSPVGAAPLAGGTVHRWAPAPSWRCTRTGDSPIFVELYISAAGLASTRSYVEIEDAATCVEPASVQARVEERTLARREGDLIDSSDPPTATAEVTSGSRDTLFVAVRDSFARVTPSAAPVAAGPTTVTAASSGSSMTATRDATTGAYAAIFDDPATFRFGEPIFWSADGGTPVELAPVPPATTLRFGPALGLDTDVLVDGEIPPGTTVRVQWEADAPTIVCHGESFRDPAFYRDGVVVDLVGGGRGLDAPIRTLLEDGATFCETTPEDLARIPFHIAISLETSDELDAGGATVGVTTARTVEIDGEALTATCPAGRTYCTSACVNTATDPMHCGGCGLMPAEVCDGADNDCDGRADEGCPNLLTAPASTLITSPSFGEGVGGSSELSTGCPYPSVATSLCGNIDTAGTMPTGNIRALRLGCGLVELVTDRSTTPWAYSLRVTGSPPCSSTGGGSSGGMAFDFPCPAGEVLEGINVVAGSHVGQIQARCARWEILPSDGTWIIARTSTSTSPMFGTGSGTAGGWVVPARSTSGFPGVIRSLGGRYEVPGTFVRVEAGGAWYSLTYR